MPEDSAPQTQNKPQRNFVRRADRPKLAHDAAARQGLVTKMAFEALGGKDAAIAYLNMASAMLGGRPIEIATVSEEGLQRVRHDLEGIRTKGSEDQAVDRAR